MTEIWAESSGRKTHWLGGLMSMPRLEPGLTLFLMFCWIKRERRGVTYCRDKLIGPLRDMARNPPVVVDVVGSNPTLQVLSECRCILALHCKGCGMCELKNAPP